MNFILPHFLEAWLKLEGKLKYPVFSSFTVMLQNVMNNLIMVHFNHKYFTVIVQYSYKFVLNTFCCIPQEGLNKVEVMANFVSPAIFQHIEECISYEKKVEGLQTLFVKPGNGIYAHHILATRHQQPHKRLDKTSKF